MAYNVSNRFREIEYSGGAEYTCKLTINNVQVPNNQIKSIVIKKPIIDTTVKQFYVGSFISDSLDIIFRNLDNLDIKSGNEVNLDIGLNVDGTITYVPQGKFLIDTLSEDYQTKCEITCLDYSTKFKPSIDYSPCFINGKATIDTILQYICTTMGVTLGDYPITNGNIEIGTYDSTVSGKQWISYIAEIKGCNAKIDRDGKITLIPLKQSSSISINALKSKLWSLGEKYQISQVIYFDAIRNFTYGDTTNNTLYIRQDNPFIQDTTTISNIYDILKDTIIYSLKTENYGDISLDSWDNITYTLGNNSYTTLCDNVLTYEMNVSSCVEIKIPSKQQQTLTNVKQADTKTEIKKVKAEIDEVNAEINLLSKKIVDISTTTNGTNSVSIVNAHQDKIHYLKLTGNISIPITCDGSNGTNSLMSGQTKSGVSKSRSSSTYCNGLVVSNDLVVNDFILNIVQNKEIYSQFVLPINYLNSYGTTFDEFTYEDGECFITRKVGINNNGSKYILKNPIKEDLGALKIILPSGSSTLEFPSLSGIKIEITYLTENDYTTTFATQVDVESQIKVASDEVLIESKSQILDGGDEIIASINTTSTGKVKIKASDIVEIEGLTTVGDKIIFNPDGSITAQDLRLLTGGKVIGGDGLLTNLNYFGTEYSYATVGIPGFAKLGYSNRIVSDSGTTSITPDTINITFKLPNNFTILSAKVYLQHLPLRTYNSFTGYTNGYSRNVKLYKESMSSSYYMINQFSYDMNMGSLSETEITNAFGSNGFTGSTSGVSETESIDIKDKIDKNTTNYFVLKCAGTASDSAEYQGAVQATLQVLGYTNFQ